MNGLWGWAGPTDADGLAIGTPVTTVSMACRSLRGHVIANLQDQRVLPRWVDGTGDGVVWQRVDGEHVYWVRGHHADDSEIVEAMRAAQALVSR